MKGNRKHISSGAPWESQVGYSRAVIAGQHIYISGTAAVDGDGNLVAPGDGVAQMRFIMKKIGDILKEAGTDFSCVTRSRIFVTDIRQWQEIGTIHGEVFKDIRPATSMVEVSALISPGMVVEVEIDGLLEENEKD